MPGAAEPGTPDTEAHARKTLRPRVLQQVWSIDVLVVEDDEADASLIQNVLRKHPNVGAAVTSTAPDMALFELATGRMRPNLIFLDIHMPKLNGFRFLEALRGIPSMRDTPVVLLTTSRLARDVEEARASSVSQYLVKPDTYDELHNRVFAVIKQMINGSWSR